MIITIFGKVVAVKKEPGLFWYAPIFRQLKFVDLGISTITVKAACPDSTGSPLNVDAVILYRITDPVAATYNINGIGLYIMNQGNQVVKRVCSKFPYRSN